MHQGPDTKRVEQRPVKRNDNLAQGSEQYRALVAMRASVLMLNEDNRGG